MNGPGVWPLKVQNSYFCVLLSGCFSTVVFMSTCTMAGCRRLSGGGTAGAKVSVAGSTGRPDSDAGVRGTACGALPRAACGVLVAAAGSTGLASQCAAASAAA